ncbi:ankyrin repeat domain-containing protein [uncultured Oceanisphaera sp.]|uniref:ankyrin repeat domain-containing protein n=1 Tax=uncultured Oceanisphaera sp. TaxID=353858 RepID=UPI002635B186|nr:ankyrin repeat domain-containing protein [uncultured Oceanisphaera sp.]
MNVFLKFKSLVFISKLIAREPKYSLKPYPVEGSCLPEIFIKQCRAILLREFVYSSQIQRINDCDMVSFNTTFGWFRLRCFILVFIFGVALFSPQLAIGEEDDYKQSISEFTSTPDGLIQLLMVGVLTHDLELIEASIAHEVDINAITAQGETALFIAASLGHPEIVRMLLQYAPPLEIDKANSEQWTPLMAAVASGHTEIVSLLLNAGAEPDRRVPMSEEKNSSARQVALLSDDPDMIALFDPQAAKALQQKYELTLNTLALFEGAVSGDSALIETGLSALNALGHPDTVIDENGWTPLMHAAANGHVDTVSQLINAGFDVNQRLGEEEMTPLMAAAANEDVPMIKLLIQSGADIVLKQRNGMTAQDIAKAIGAQLSVLEFLGAPPEQIDPIITLRNGNMTQVMALLDTRRLTTNWRDEQGWTALMHAVDGNNLRAAALLLDKFGGKQAQHITRDDQSALTIAIARGHDKMVNLLIEHGAPVEQKIRGRMSLDAFARARKQPAMAKRLKQAIQSQTLALQQELLLSGFDVGRPDGVSGKMTKAAFNKLKKSRSYIGSYAEAVQVLKRKRRSNMVWFCNVSKEDEIYFSVGYTHREVVEGHWSVKRNTCRDWELKRKVPGLYVYKQSRITYVEFTSYSL